MGKDSGKKMIDLGKKMSGKTWLLLTDFLRLTDFLKAKIQRTFVKIVNRSLTLPENMQSVRFQKISKGP